MRPQDESASGRRWSPRFNLWPLRSLLACVFILIGLAGLGVDSEYLVWTTLPACGCLLAGLYLLSREA